MKPMIEPKNENGDSAYLALRDMRPAWHLHDGFMRLYIVGAIHQPKGWFPVTAPSSEKRKKHGTPEERAIAEKAVEWLRIHQFENAEAGPAEIREALMRFGWQEDPFTKYPS